METLSVFHFPPLMFFLVFSLTEEQKQMLGLLKWNILVAQILFWKRKRCALLHIQYGVARLPITVYNFLEGLISLSQWFNGSWSRG